MDPLKLTVGRLQKPAKVAKTRKIIEAERKEKSVSSQANIRDTPFDQKSPGHPEVGVLNCHRQTDRHTDGHGDSMTELTQWADAVRFFNNEKSIKNAT